MVFVLRAASANCDQTERTEGQDAKLDDRETREIELTLDKRLRGIVGIDVAADGRLRGVERGVMRVLRGVIVDVAADDKTAG